MKHKQWLAAGGMATLGSAAWAQSDVQMFGVLDIHLNTAKSGPTRVMRVEDGGDAASRVGLRGTEDLGNGLRGHYMLEAGIFLHSGSGTLPGPGLAFTRQSYVGLRGDWGVVDVGRMYTPMFSALFRGDPFGMNALFSSLNLAYATDAQPGVRPFSARASNMLRYRTPSSQPWLLDLAYAFDATPATHDSNGRLMGTTVGWSRKPLFLAYSWQQYLEGSANAPLNLHRSSHQEALSASWELRPDLRLTGNYLVSHGDFLKTATAKLTQLGMEWRLDTRFKLLASVGHRSVGGSDRAQRTWTLGCDYDISTRTLLYGRWLQLGNTANASASMANMAVRAQSGDGVQSLAVGLRHTF
jgi:predicted porin